MKNNHNRIYFANIKWLRLSNPGILTAFCFCLVSLYYRLDAQTVIGGISPDVSAILDVQSNSKGVLFPRLTSSERNGIISPATGLMIFNTTTSCLEINLGGTNSPLWQNIICKPATVASVTVSSTPMTGSLLLPNTPAAGQTISISYSGGDGGSYFGETVYSTGVTGLTATLAPGTFAVGSGTLTYTIGGTPSTSGEANFALQIGGQSANVTIRVGCGAYMAAGQWKALACHNLGANVSANPFTPSWDLNGDYYKWGVATKAVDGPSGPGPTEANDGIITGFSFSIAPNGSWVDTNPMGNNPCPTGFRVPTMAQWEAICNTQLNPATTVGNSWVPGATNYANGRLFGTNLFLPAAGYRNFVNGLLYERGFTGQYWSSTESPMDRGWMMVLSDGAASNTAVSRSEVKSIRCIAE